MKEAMPCFAANEKLRKRITDDILSGRFSHAYIIEGAKGTGKKTLAKTIAAALGCLNKGTDALPLPCMNCAHCHKISENISPDVTIIKRDRDKASVGVDAARFIRSDVSIIPNELDYKIYIIDEADKMTVQAQNALLLTLEEPPAFAVFLLLCERADALLETVRSRAPIIRTERLQNEVLSDYLISKAPDEYRLEASRLYRTAPAEFSEILAVASGSIGRAYELLDPKKRAAVLEARRIIRDFVHVMVMRSQFSEMYEAIGAFSQKRDELADQLDEVCLAVRDLIAVKKDESAPLSFYSDREAALNLSDERSISYLLRLFNTCETAAESIRKNANVKLTLLGIITG